MKIEILGSGCRNCEQLHENVLKALDQAGLREQAEVKKVADLDEILKRGVYTTPGLVVDDEVVSAGRLLSPEQIAAELQARAATG